MLKNKLRVFGYLRYFYGLKHAIGVLRCPECEKPDINTLWRCSSHKLESFRLLAKRGNEL